MRVLAPFGKNKQLSGVVYEVHSRRPQHYETKPIILVLDEKPLVLPLQLELWKWISDYYQCAMGEVYRAALPSGLKMESETRFYFNPDFGAEDVLSDRVVPILDYLAKEKSSSITEINKITGLKNSHAIIKQLIEQNAIFVDERVPEKFRIKKEMFFSLSEAVRSEAALNDAFDRLAKAPKQLNLLMTFIQQTGNLTSAIKGKEISRKELLAQTEPNASAQLNELLKKDVLVQHERETGRLDFSETATVSKRVLSDCQQTAFDEIREGFAENRPVLLHGVTSSGKTEIYIHLIDDAIKNNRQSLYLLPEIALTTQITSRLKAHFGNRLGVYHSKYSDAERVEVWNDLLSQKNYRVIVGVRSSIFLPFTNLGLIIVDEEHESSFKQYDPAPRYHARDVALVLGAKHNANVLLGTATPSVESYYNASTAKYRLVELFERYEGIRLPQIIVADTRDAKRRKIMTENFTPELVERMKKALKNREQIILFQNRRGFAPYLECNMCAWVPKCVHCDVSMTYHKNSESLVCHYCGYTIPTHTVCQACGSPALNARGFGTEKIEEDVKALFPEAGVARMDYDTTRSKTGYERIIADFESGKLDILIGTQMVSKGLDFDRVSLVGILNADTMLNTPDFRAFEKSFQMLAQVSGRAGRKNRQGAVVLQTGNPAHPVISYVYHNNYSDFFAQQLEEREQYKYPPFYRLTFIVLKHRNGGVVNQAANQLAAMLRAVFGARVSGPQEPPVKRINDYHLQRILLKVERTASAHKAKTLIRENINLLLSNERWRYVSIAIDVDPV
jgi:primosomal protein N' (replication factor Y)